MPGIAPGASFVYYHMHSYLQQDCHGPTYVATRPSPAFYGIAKLGARPSINYGTIIYSYTENFQL